MYRLIFILFLLPALSVAQKVSFCERVGRDGNPVNEASSFAVGKQGGFFKVLLTLNRPVESGKVIYDIYHLDNEKKEILDNSIRMDVNPTLTWFYKEITFHKPGSYVIYIYDEKDKLLGVGKVDIYEKR
jgi:hypothetical protein